MNEPFSVGGYFSVEKSANLAQVNPPDRIHIIGVCGVAMAQLALQLARMGFRVSGSDREFYEPMGTLLRSSTVELKQGYSPGNIAADTKLVVIGNVVSAGHPETGELARRGLAYTFFPKILRDLIIADRHSIVISGTHGKSTTTALMTHVLTAHNEDPSYFVGAAVPDLPHGLYCGKGKYSVVEGDEYDSAFFAKVPKFSFYRPDTLVVTSVEYDHADIYPSLSAINNEFQKLVTGMSSAGVAVCCVDNSNLRELVGEWKGSCSCRVVTYGAAADADYRLAECSSSATGQSVVLELSGTKREFECRLIGSHNALNALAVIAVADLLGLPFDKTAQAISAFGGVRRRQEVRFSRAGVTVIEDFAHHPSAVAETLRAVKTAYSNRRLWAVFEPRSNTSRRRVFQDDYVRAFAPAQLALLAQVQSRAADAGQDLLDVGELAAKIGAAGLAAEALPDADTIAARLLSEVIPGDVVVIMSNGSFGGLIDKVVADLDRKFKI